MTDWGVDMDLPDFGTANDANLPPELQGQDLLPDGLEKIEGEDRTAMQRVIICYYGQDAHKVADLLGIDKIDKVMYRLDELGK